MRLSGPVIFRPLARVARDILQAYLTFRDEIAQRT